MEGRESRQPGLGSCQGPSGCASHQGHPGTRRRRMGVTVAQRAGPVCPSGSTGSPSRNPGLASSGFAELTPNVEPLIALEDGRTVENPAHRAEKLALRDAIASGGMSENEVAAYARGEVPTLTGAPPAFVAGALVSRRMPELGGVTRQPEPE